MMIKQFRRNRINETKYRDNANSSRVLPHIFAMRIDEDDIYPCNNIEHAIAAACKHSKRDGFNTWAPCVYIQGQGFYMIDIFKKEELHRRANELDANTY